MRGMIAPAVIATSLISATQVGAQIEGFGINCAIRPLQIVEIAAPINGIVKEVFVRPGTRVSEGDIIAKFDSDIAESELLAAQLRSTLTAGRDSALAQRDALAKKVGRLEQGVARRAVSEADLNAAQLELTLAQGTLSREADALRIAELDVQRAQITLDKSTIYSPVSGLVGEDIIDVGESPQGRQVAIIYVNDPLRVEAYVPTGLLAAFLGKPSFEIVVNGNRDVPISVTLDYVSQVADLSSNTQSVYFMLDAPNILPGYQCLFPADMN